MMRVTPRVQLDCVGSQVARPSNHFARRINEERCADPRRAHSIDPGLEGRDVATDVEPTLGRDFLSPLRDKGNLERPVTFGDEQHLRCVRHLQIEHGIHGRHQTLDVVVLDVTPVFAQMGGNAVRARAFALEGGGDGIGFVSASRLSKRGDMVDVYVQSLIGGAKRGHVGTAPVVAGTFG